MLKMLMRKIRLFAITYPIVYLIKGMLKLIMWTCKVEIQGIEQFNDYAKQNKCIIMLWHNRLAMIPEILKGYAPYFTYRAVISKSRDGEILAILTKSYSAGRTLRVPHNERYQALHRMIRFVKQSNEVLIVTPDGPKGPIYEIKPGIILAAKETSANIIPLSWHASKYWELSTWDKLILPKPFSKIFIVFGSPIYLEKKSSKSFSEEASYLESALQSLDQKIKQLKELR